MDKQYLEGLIRQVPDFPQPGVLFLDVMPLLQKHFSATIDALSALMTEAEWSKVDAVVGVEARGFLLASALAYVHQKGLLVVRKPGKLPPPVLEQSYALEYGLDRLQLSALAAASGVVVVDDVLATGGTLQATCSLLQAGGHSVHCLLTLINLATLNNFHWEDLRVRSLWTYGHLAGNPRAEGADVDVP